MQVPPDRRDSYDGLPPPSSLRTRVRGPRPPSLTINTANAPPATAPPIQLLPSFQEARDVSPTRLTPTRHKGRNHSFSFPAISPLRTPKTSDVSDHETSSAFPAFKESFSRSRDSAAAGNSRNEDQVGDKGRYETRKLLLHLLEQLRKARLRAPSVFESVTAFKDVKGKGKAVEPDSSDEDDFIIGQARRRSKVPDWGTTTFDLLLQLRDVLLVSEKKGWNLFMSSEQDDSDPHSNVPPSPSSPSASPHRRFMRTSPTSPTSPTNPVSGAALFYSTLSILSEACLLASQPLPSFRPSMPPLSLQSIILDVAIIILKSMRGRARETEAVATSLLGGFGGWGEGMKGRLLAFYEGLALETLERLGRRTGRPPLRPNGTGAHSSRSGMPVPPVAIQVDEPADARLEFPAPPSRKGSATIEVGHRALTSSYAGDQPLVVYQLTALVAPLLNATLANISPVRSSMDTLYRLHRLIESLVRLKPDLYLDLLDVVAYGDSTARHSALSILIHFWPKAIGQPSIAPPFPRFNYRDDVWRLETQNSKMPMSASDQVQHFIPWRFPGVDRTDTSRPPSFLVDADPATFVLAAYTDVNVCNVCQLPVRGFGLLSLSGSYEPLHLRCHNSVEGSFMSHYVTPNNMNRIAAPRFSLVPINKRALVIPAQSSDEEKSIPPNNLNISGHRFRLVNLFTLMVCYLCRKPLWGTVMQGYKCSGCRHFAHHDCLVHSASLPACLPRELAPIAEITVDHKALRLDFLEHYRDIILSDEQLKRLSYEEVTVFHMVFWVQQQILDSGVASGTIVVNQVGPTKKAREAIDKFELHWLTQLYAAYRGTLDASNGMEEFKDMNGEDEESEPDFFQFPLLVFITALMRAPVESLPDRLPTGDEEEVASGVCYDEVQLSLMRDVMERDLDLRHPKAVDYLLEHLHHMGFFERKDARLTLFSSQVPIDISIVFPLPSLIDPSPSVESLVTAIESCLRDTDLSVQEAGLLILVRRCWPSPFASRYALERLTRAVLRWLLDDKALLEVTREQVASASARHTDSHRASLRGESRTGGDYVSQRNLMVERLAAQWLRALHDLSPAQYGEFLFTQTATVSALEGARSQGTRSNGDISDNEHTVAFTELLLRNLIRLHQAEVVFSTFDDLFSRWLDEVAATWQSLSRDDEPLSFRSLIRLFRATPTDSSHHRRNSSVQMIPGAAMVEEPSPLTGNVVDPWKVLLDTSRDGILGLRRAMRWLRILAQSGVDVSIEVFEHLAELCSQRDAVFQDAVDLSEALFASAWNRGINRKGLATVASTLYSSRYQQVKASLDESRDVDVTLLFMRRTLSSFLLAAGGSADTLVELGFASESQARILGSSRKRRSFIGGGSSEVNCDTTFLNCLTRQCQCEVFVARAVIGKFLYALLAGKTAFATKVETIKFNAGILSSCVFRLFDISQTDLTDIRIKLLLTLLSADGATFRRLLKLVCSAEAWEHRFTTLDTLFLMITELHIPASGDSPAGSLPHFFPVIYHFFEFLSDSEEPVRQKVNTLIQALRPYHFAVMAQSLQARYNLGTTQERIEICQLLTSIRAVLPTWQVLSWSTVIDGLFVKELNDKLANVALKDKVVNDELWLQLLNLALLMVAEGMELDRPSTLAKIKYHALKALGFSDVALRPSFPSGNVEVTFGPQAPIMGPSSLVALASLTRVLDCPKQVMTHGSDGNATTDLIGSSFVDLVPSLVTSALDFRVLTYIQIRDVLECLSISIFKHDIERNPKTTERVVGAVRSILDLVLLDTISYDNKILILLICTSFIRQYEHLSVKVLLPQILAISEMLATSDADGLWKHGTVFLEIAFVKFASKGLFVLLFKNISESEDFKLLNVWAQVLHAAVGPEDAPPMREAPFYDVFRLVASQKPVTSSVMNCLAKFAEVGHPKDWSVELLQAFVQFLDRLPRHLAADVDPAEPFDPNLTIGLVVMVIKSHSQHATVFLEQLATLFRAWLPQLDFKTETITEALNSCRTKQQEAPIAHVMGAAADTLADGLRSREAVSTLTMSALTEALLIDCGAPYAVSRASVRARPSVSGWSRVLADDPSKTCEDAVAFLRTTFESPLVKFTRALFDVMRKAGDLILLTVRLDPACWEYCKGQESIQTLRTINVVLLGELNNPVRLTLLQYIASISTAATIPLRTCVQSAFSLSVTSEIVAQVFANVRLIVLLASLGGGRDAVEEYWRGLWPACEKLLSSTEMDGDLTPVGSIVWTSFADLILFLHQANSPLALDNASAWSSLLENVRASGRQDPIGSKLARALASFSDPPKRLEFDVLVAQASTEVFVAAKLRHQVLQGLSM